MVVREGDTLFALAEWFGISPFDFASANGITADDYLYIGVEVAIPIPASQYAEPPMPELDFVSEVPAAIEAPHPATAVVLPVVTPAPAPPPTSWSKDDVVAAICSLPWPCEKMVAVASCESGLNPNSVNPIGYYGLFQINYIFDGWNDPWVNASVAYNSKYLPALAYGNGLSPWPVCQYY